MQDIAALPANDVTNELAHAMAACVRAVREQNEHEGVVLMLVQPGERNSYDQQVGKALGPQLALQS